MKRVLSTLTAMAALPTLAMAAQKPNLLIIMTDEHNFRTLSCYRDNLPKEQGEVWGAEAAKIMTPNLDRLAEMGALFQNFYSIQPVSSPSRGAFFTGLYPQRNGVMKNDVFMNDVPTIGDMLRDNGYETGYCGKLHLNGDAKPGWHPERDFGFTDNRYMFNRGHWKFLKIEEDGSGKVMDDVPGAIKKLNDSNFTTDFLADRTIEFISENRDKPFCYVMNIPDPHDPNRVREPYASLYHETKFELPATANMADKYKIPGIKEPAPKSLAFNKPNHYFAHYFSMVKCIDDNVGRVMKHLEEEGILDNTIIIFTADHGDMMGEHGLDNKGVPYDASAKVPTLLYCKGKIKAGSIVKPVINSVDFVPTVLSLMGIENTSNGDGRDCSQIITSGKTPKGWNDMVISKMGGWIAVATPDYKLIITSKAGSTPCLFDLKSDPMELRNVFADGKNSAIIKSMTSFLDDYMAKSKEPLAKNESVMNQIKNILTAK